jgi:hypothetical protein
MPFFPSSSIVGTRIDSIKVLIHIAGASAVTLHKHFSGLMTATASATLGGAEGDGKSGVRKVPMPSAVLEVTDDSDDAIALSAARAATISGLAPVSASSEHRPES